MFKETMESCNYIKSKTSLTPEIAIILGSGLGAFADKLEEKCIIPYEDIPHFEKSTAPGHSGKMIIGKIKGKTILCMQGRFHYYEGYSMAKITYPVRVMKVLGIKKLLLTNAAGGLSKDFRPGDLMIITDHINFMGNNPLIGKNEDEFGPRFCDMSYAYNPEMRSIISKAAEKINLKMQQGVYIGYSGPSFETPAEIRLFQSFGAQAVGMSTVPEVIVANQCGIFVAGISCITNMAAGILDQPISGEEVIEMAEKVKPVFISLLENVVDLL